MADDETTEEAASPTGRRAFMAGAAGLAAGATLLGAGSPAGAAVPATGEHDLDLLWVDLGTGVTTPVGLGTGGLAKGIFSAYGDMAAATIRIKLGAGATPGSGPWGLLATDMPSGYLPATPPDDMTPGTMAWQGTGLAVNPDNVFQNSYFVACAWTNYVSTGGPVVLQWTLPDRHNEGNGNVLFNYGGSVPFGAALGEGAMLYSTVAYLREPEVE